MVRCSCDSFMCRYPHEGKRCERSAPANGARCSQCEGRTTGPARGSVPTANQRLGVASSVPTALGEKTGKKVAWESFPREQEKGTHAGRVQISTKRLIPFPEVAERFREGTRVQLVLAQGDTELLDANGQSVGFESGFEQVADENGVVQFDRCFFGKVATTKKIVQDVEVRNGTYLPPRRRRKGQSAPDRFHFWFFAQIIDPHGKPPRVVALKKQWRFRMVSKLDLIQDHLFLEWRLAFNAPYNARVSYLNDEAASSSTGSSAAVQEEAAAVPAAGLADFPLFPEDPVAAGMPELEPGSPSLLKRQKSDHEAESSSADSSAVAPATTRSPYTFGDDPFYFQLLGGTKMTLLVDPTTEISFAALVKAILESLLAISRFSQETDSLDVDYKQMCVDRLEKQLADQGGTKLLFGGEPLAPGYMDPLTSLVERLRVVVIVTTEDVAKDIDLLRGIRHPLDTFPATGFEVLFPEEDTLAGTVPMAPGSSPPATDAPIEFISVKDEPAREVCVKEEHLLDEDIARMREFWRRLPHQRIDSVVERVDLTDCSRGVVLGVDEDAPNEVHVLFNGAEEVESNLKVGEDVLLVELPVLQ